jgi:hypothetical protein
LVHLEEILNSLYVTVNLLGHEVSAQYDRLYAL